MNKLITYKLSPAWTMRQVGSSLIISGGADARYEIELETEQLSFFASLKKTTSFTRKQLSTQDQSVLEELITAEIIVPVLASHKPLQFAVIGDVPLKLEAKDIKQIEKSDACHVLVITRTTNSYARLLQKLDYQAITKPHLFVDLAFHHTLSVGPLVFPGETACIACLQGRVTTRWQDDTPPPQPKVTTDYQRVIEDIVAAELNRIAHQDTGLTNKTVGWNLQDRVVKSNQLLKVPICPVCSVNKLDRDGASALPWV